MKIKGTLLIAFTALFFLNCSQEESTGDDNLLSEAGGAILGQWFLVAVGDTDVSSTECYQDSYLEASRTDLTFFIQDRQQDGSCLTVLDETVRYTEEEGFYYLENEAIEIYIEGSMLTWRVNFETTLVFQKN
ncbi:MAG: hypothetical protein AAGL29_07810 [Bacteroidota bacterium]